MDLKGKVVLITGAKRGIRYAAAARFASDEASYMTGSVIVVDGGWTAQ